MIETVDADARVRLRSRLPVLWLILLALAAVLLPHRVWNMLLLGFGGLIVLAYIWARSLALGLRGSRRLRYGWVAVGDRLLEDFVVEYERGLPALWVEVIDESNVPGYQGSVVQSVVGRQTRWRRDAFCKQRGQFHLGPWTLRSADPFGIFEARRRYPVSEEFIIHPPVDLGLPVPLPAGRSSGRVSTHERAVAATINAAGVRDYHTSDPFRWIHWPTTARKGRLHVRQFDLDAAGDIWLLLDMAAATRLGQGWASTEEYGVSLAASLAAQALRHNRAVGLAAYGRRPQLIPPARGRGQEWRILRGLALVNADGLVSLGRALVDLTGLVRRGSALVVFTADGTGDWFPPLVNLARSGVSCRVTLLDRSSFGGAGNAPAQAEILRPLGVETQIVRQGELRPPDAARPPEGVWEFKTTATGRVIVVREPRALP